MIKKKNNSKRLTAASVVFIAAIIISMTVGGTFVFGDDAVKEQKQLDAATIAANNRGVGLMGQFKYEDARQQFEKLAKEYPGNVEFRINEAIALFNRQKEGDERAALAMLADVLKKQPGNLRARYCYGLLELHQGNAEKALELFQTVLKAEPGDADVLYFIGKTLVQLSRHAEAIDFFKRSVEKDQYLQSNYYGMLMAMRQLGRNNEARTVIREFQKMRNNPRARLVEFKYTKMGRKAEVKTLDLADTAPRKKTSGPLFTKEKPLPLKGTANWRKKLTESTVKPSVTICDIDGNNTSDIFITGSTEKAGGNGNVLLLAGPDGKEYVADEKNPLASVTGVNSALWGDIDGDGRVDVYLCRRGPNQLWYQEKPGEWRNVTEKTGTAHGQYDTVDGAVIDADHDGDLDIFIVNADGPNELLNNNRDGSFRPLAAEYRLAGSQTASRSIVVSDLDADRDADLIIINRKPPHEVYINQRLWKYDPAEGFETFVAADITAAVVGDVDTDGHIEIYTTDSKSTLTRWAQGENKKWNGTVLSETRNRKTTGTGNNGTVNRLALTDADGDGRLDVILSDENGWQAVSIEGDTRKTLFASKTGKKRSSIQTWAVLTSVNGPAVVGWNTGKTPVIWSPGTGRYGFALLGLSGGINPDAQLRSNVSGIGARVAIRIGSDWTVRDTYRSNSGPGQSLQPLAVGLGGAARLDFIAVDWSDGVYQTELALEAGKFHRINEVQRQLSSCPVLFAWNGEKFEFVSDFLGVGGIGYAVGPGEYSESRPWERYMLPQGLLKPRNGRFMIKLMEPMEEAAYLDAVRMTAYDLPPGWQMAMDERMAIMGPAATGEPIFYHEQMLPTEVVNERGQNVTAELAKGDMKAAQPGEPDPRFIGLLNQDHVLTLTFPAELDSLKGKPYLVADGWVEYPYSQTNFAAWQAGAAYRAPTIEVAGESDNWTVLMEQFGYPAGMPRRMAVPLVGLPGGTCRLRISTNQEIYWDHFTVVYVLENSEVQRHELKLTAAECEQMGFPRRYTYPQRRPYYDYDDRLPFWDTRYQEGYYTRFGPVEELIEKTDNAVVIFGAGEGVHLEFLTHPQPPRKGWTRVYIVETDGWCKDMDLYTDTGETIEPVPSSGKLTPRVKELHRRYNSRYLSGQQ
jgi:hypothetical protein